MVIAAKSSGTTAQLSYFSRPNCCVYLPCSNPDSQLTAATRCSLSNSDDALSHSDLSLLLPQPYCSIPSQHSATMVPLALCSGISYTVHWTFFAAPSTDSVDTWASLLMHTSHCCWPVTHTACSKPPLVPWYDWLAPSFASCCFLLTYCSLAASYLLSPPNDSFSYRPTSCRPRFWTASC